MSARPVAANAAAPLDALGPLMSDTVLSMHLNYDAPSATFSLDLSDMADYEPMAGFARLGGRCARVHKLASPRQTALPAPLSSLRRCWS